MSVTGPFSKWLSLVRNRWLTLIRNQWLSLARNRWLSLVRNNQPYHKIKITFDPEGGGSDFEDEFLYWIHQTNHTVDYLAYSFHVEEGGLRFREAYNVRDIKGILFSDYNNYEPASDALTLGELDAAFENSGLKKLSEINLENITLKTETFKSKK